MFPPQEAPVKSFPFLLVLLLVAPLALAGEKKVVTTSSGLKVEILRPGKPGTRPSPGDRVYVQYTGTLTDGTKFDSSYDRGVPFSFVLGQGKVIKGWDEGIALLDVGSKAKLTVPPSLGYGNRQIGKIPASSTLVFTVELVKVLREIPFVKPDPKKLTKTDSGLKYQVLKKGKGDHPRADQGVSVTFSFFDESGKRLASSAQLGGRLGGLVSTLSLGRFKLSFLPEAAKLMRPGGQYLFVVPPALAFGSRKLRGLPPNTVTVWRLNLDSVNEVPAFRLPDEKKAKKTKSGIVYEVIKKGTGRRAKTTDRVEVHYTGWLTNGTLFDSSRARGEPITFSLAKVIPGWREGVALMKEGGVYLFRIPANLAYGSNPPPGSPVPPNADLVFLVELLHVK